MQSYINGLNIVHDFCNSRDLHESVFKCLALFIETIDIFTFSFESNIYADTMKKKNPCAITCLEFSWPTNNIGFYCYQVLLHE